MRRCVCCRKIKDDVQPRSGSVGNPGAEVRLPSQPLCQACWDDPADKYSDCKHGEGGHPSSRCECGCIRAEHNDVGVCKNNPDGSSFVQHKDMCRSFRPQGERPMFEELDPSSGRYHGHTGGGAGYAGKQWVHQHDGGNMEHEHFRQGVHTTGYHATGYQENVPDRLPPDIRDKDISKSMAAPSCTKCGAEIAHLDRVQFRDKYTGRMKQGTLDLSAGSRIPNTVMVSVTHKQARGGGIASMNRAVWASQIAHVECPVKKGQVVSFAAKKYAPKDPCAKHSAYEKDNCPGCGTQTKVGEAPWMKKSLNDMHSHEDDEMGTFRGAHQHLFDEGDDHYHTSASGDDVSVKPHDVPGHACSACGGLRGLRTRGAAQISPVPDKVPKTWARIRPKKEYPPEITARARYVPSKREAEVGKRVDTILALRHKFHGTATDRMGKSNGAPDCVTCGHGQEEHHWDSASTKDASCKLCACDNYKKEQTCVDCQHGESEHNTSRAWDSQGIVEHGCDNCKCITFRRPSVGRWARERPRKIPADKRLDTVMALRDKWHGTGHSIVDKSMADGEGHLDFPESGADLYNHMLTGHGRGTKTGWNLFSGEVDLEHPRVKAQLHRLHVGDHEKSKRPFVAKAAQRPALSKGWQNTFCADCGHLRSEHDFPTDDNGGCGHLFESAQDAPKGTPRRYTIPGHCTDGFREKGEHAWNCKKQLGESPPGHVQCYCARAEEKMEHSGFPICGCGHAMESHHYPIEQAGTNGNFCNRGGCECNGYHEKVKIPEQLPSSIRDMKIDKGRGTFPCANCDQPFETRAKLAAHQRKEVTLTLSGPRFCRECRADLTGMKAIDIGKHMGGHPEGHRAVITGLRAGYGGLPERATQEPANGARHRSTSCAFGYHEGCDKVVQTHPKNPAAKAGRKLTCDCRCHPSDRLPDDIRDMDIEKGRRAVEIVSPKSYGKVGAWCKAPEIPDTCHNLGHGIARARASGWAEDDEGWRYGLCSKHVKKPDDYHSTMKITGPREKVHVPDRLPEDMGKSFEPEEHNESGRYYFPIGCKNCLHNEIGHAVGKRKGIACDGPPSYCTAQVSFKGGKEVRTEHSEANPCEHSSCPANKRLMDANEGKKGAKLKCACPGFDGGFKGDAFAKPKNLGEEHDIGGFKFRVGQTYSDKDMEWALGQKVKPGINVIRGKSKLKVKVPDKLPKNFGKSRELPSGPGWRQNSKPPLHRDARGDVFAISSRRAKLGLFWHGTPSGEVGSGDAKYGLHVGTKRAASEALNARIGTPSKGIWDGKREYGKTPLGRATAGRGDIGSLTGYNSDHKPGLPDGSATYSDGTKIPLTAKPNIVPVRIAGPMSNSPFAPHDDFKANGMMAGQKKRGTAKRGYFYVNRGEDEGTVSAVVPSAQHVLRLRKSGDYCGADSDESPEVAEEKLHDTAETSSPKEFASTCKKRGSYSGLLAPSGKVYAKPGYQEHENMIDQAHMHHDYHGLVNGHGWARLSTKGANMNIDFNHDVMSRDTAARLHQVASLHGRVNGWTCYGQHRGGWEYGRDGASLAEHLEEEASKKSLAKSRPHQKDRGEWNGRRFWSGIVGHDDGRIEEVHPYRTAEAADFHHSHYVSPEACERMKEGDSHFFWINDKHKPQLWDGSWADDKSGSQALHDRLASQIGSQIKVHP